MRPATVDAYRRTYRRAAFPVLVTVEGVRGHYGGMRTSPALASLLTMLTSAIAGCGGDSSPTPGVDASLDGTAMSDGAALTDGAATTDAAGADAAQADAGCPRGTQPSDGGCIPLTVRRPFLVGSSLRASVASARADWAPRALAAAALDPVTRARLAEAWLRDALEEHASIAAFARFTMLLLSLGAPPELVVQSQQASIDEVSHAKRCFALAARYGATRRGPSTLVVSDALRAMSLAEVAALTAEEGCVGETLGAVLAAEQRDRATDPEVKRALIGIAADEERHAALAWRFVRWAVLEGGRDVRAAVERAIERAIEATLAMEIRRYDGVDLEAWHAHGRVTCAEARVLAAQGIEAIVRPCLAHV
jgi:hypothetical protein